MVLNRAVLVVLAAGALGAGCADLQPEVGSDEEAILVDGFDLNPMMDCMANQAFGRAFPTLDLTYPKGEQTLIAAVRQGPGPDGDVVWFGQGSSKEIVVQLRPVAVGKGDYRVQVYAGKWPVSKPAPWTGTWSDNYGKPCYPKLLHYSPTCNPDPPPPCPPQ